MGGEVGHHCGPFTADARVRGELGEQGGGQLQLDDPASTRRQVPGSALERDAVRSATGDTRQEQLSGRVGDSEAPFGGALGDHHGTGDFCVDRAPPGDLTRVPITSEQG